MKTRITNYVDRLSHFFGKKKASTCGCSSCGQSTDSYQFIDWFQSRSFAIMVSALLLNVMPGMSSSLLFTINWITLALLVAPHIQSCFESEGSKEAFLTMLAATFIWVCPLSLFIKWSCYLSVMLYSFSVMLKPSNTRSFALYAFCVGTLVSALGIYVSESMFLLMLIPFSYQLIYHNETSIHGHFPLVLAVSSTLVLTILSNIMGLGHIVCLDEAILSCFILEIRGMFNQNSAPPNGVLKAGIPAPAAGKVLNVENVSVLLHKCEETEVCEYLQPHKRAEYRELGHESNSFVISDFTDQKVPINAVFTSDVNIEYDSSPKNKDGVVQFDRIVSTTVPALLLVSLYGALIAYVMGATPVVCASLAIVGSMANCPCVFYVIDIYQWIIGANSAKTDYNVHYNLKAKLSLWPNLSQTLSSYFYGFDRTGTTFFRSNHDTKDSVYQVDTNASSYLGGLNKDKKFFLSAAGAKQAFKDSFIKAANFMGFNKNNVLCHEDFKNSEKKQARLQKHIGGNSVIYFGDGQNDADIMKLKNCLGVGVQPVSVVAKYASLIVSKPTAYKDMGMLLARLIYSQNHASFLMLGAVLANTIAVTLPIVMWMIKGEVLPLWVSCVISSGASGLLFVGSTISAYMSPHHQSDVPGHGHGQGNSGTGCKRCKCCC